jgi:putative transposase
VIKCVASYFELAPGEVTKRTKGPQQENKPRKLAMYLCQRLSGAKLHEIASQFSLTNIGSVSFITHQVRKRASEDNVYNREVEALVKSIIKNAI